MCYPFKLIAALFFVLVLVCEFTGCMDNDDQKCTPSHQCPAATEATKRLRDYQIEVNNDSTVIWDGDRKVIALPYDSTQALDKAINQDNK